MNNAEKFKQLFGIYATELWAMPEKDFLEWLNEKAQLSQEGSTKDATSDTISRQAAIELAMKYCPDDDGAVQCDGDIRELLDELENLPPTQPEYEPVTAEDFARAMSETSVYSYMAWHSEALALMEGQGFVICKKTI